MITFQVKAWLFFRNCEEVFTGRRKMVVYKIQKEEQKRT